jgi:hypothetical protein
MKIFTTWAIGSGIVACKQKWSPVVGQAEAEVKELFSV